MSNEYIATIRETSERAVAWMRVFGGRMVPILSPIPVWAQAPGVEAGLFYQVDLTTLTPEQRTRMVQHIARTFSLSEAEVDATLDEVGCPLLADDVTVMVTSPQRWVGGRDSTEQEQTP